MGRAGSGAWSATRRRWSSPASRGPHSLALANAYGAVLFYCLGDEDEMAARAQAAIDLCEKYGFVYYGEWGQILLAWHDRNTNGIE